MRVLFIHPNMPGQYKHLARILAEDKNNEVVFLTKPKPGVDIPGVKKVEYQVKREPQPECHRYAISFEKAIFASQEVWRVCKSLKDQGFVPDVIVGHLGWGDGLYLKEIYPDAKVLAFMEFFYGADSADVGFLDDDPVSADDACRIKSRNALHLFNLTYCDWAITPTFFQRDRHPDIFHPKMSVLHDGVDTSDVTPSEGRSLTLPNGLKLSKNDEVVTYIARNFEPYRGFPQWMRAAAEILKRRPNCHIIMVGQDGVSYGKDAPKGTSYREMMMEECDIDMDRFHFLGYLPYDDMKLVMKISSAHIYLTVPFVLSWSMMEAMAAECLMITSDTGPVREVIKDGYNGLMVDFFEHNQIADRVDDVFAHPDRMQELCKNARKTVLARYSLDKVLDLHIELIQDLADGKVPPPAAAKIVKFNEDTDLGA
jgi:glycosyltransferase involved in cell wall biosynthesis